MKIGLVPISAKPYHVGHHALVELAASQNDRVLLFVSISDRSRKEEFPISGKDMLRIWQDHLEAIMPGNVSIEYGGSPVRKVYEEIGKACEEGSDDTYMVYSDPEDTATNYPQDYKDKYMQPLCDSGQVKFAGETDPDSVTRGVGTPDVSGTQARKYLKSGDFTSFMSVMPAGVDGKSVFDILTAEFKNENVLKNYVSAILKM